MKEKGKTELKTKDWEKEDCKKNRRRNKVEKRFRKNISGVKGKEQSRMVENREYKRDKELTR